MYIYRGKRWTLEDITQASFPRDRDLTYFKLLLPYCDAQLYDPRCFNVITGSFLLQ